MDAQSFDALRSLIAPQVSSELQAIEIAGALLAPASPEGAAPTDALALPQLPPAPPVPAQTDAAALTAAFIHRAGTPTTAQQYATLEAQANEQLYAPVPMQDDPIADALALEMLLAQNGSLFNGAAGGIAGTGGDANTQAALNALRERKKQPERRHERVNGIPTMSTDLGLSNHDLRDEGTDFEDQMEYLVQSTAIDSEALYQSLGEQYSSFSNHSGGMIS